MSMSIPRGRAGFNWADTTSGTASKPPVAVPQPIHKGLRSRGVECQLPKLDGGGSNPLARFSSSQTWLCDRPRCHGRSRSFSSGRHSTDTHDATKNPKTATIADDRPTIEARRKRMPARQIGGMLIDKSGRRSPECSPGCCLGPMVSPPTSPDVSVHRPMNTCRGRLRQVGHYWVRRSANSYKPSPPL